MIEIGQIIISMVNVKKIIKLNPDVVKFSALTPYPGTRVYEEIKAGKWGIMTAETSKLTGYFVTFRPYGYASLEELEKIRRYAFRRYYLRFRYIWDRLILIRNIDDVIGYWKGLMAVISLKAD